MATKRRKVWVNPYPDRLSRVAYPSKRLAERGANYESKALAFVERLPGDVVLSREEVKRLTELIEDEWHDDGRDADREREIRALLRGRR